DGARYYFRLVERPRPRALGLCSPVFDVVGRARVHLEEVPLVGALELEHGLRQGLRRPLPVIEMPPEADRRAVGRLAEQGVPYAFTMGHRNRLIGCCFMASKSDAKGTIYGIVHVFDRTRKGRAGEETPYASPSGGAR